MQEPCRLGDDIRDVLRLRDTVVDFELTFNRPDCLALLGIARETAASGRRAAGGTRAGGTYRRRRRRTFPTTFP